MRLAGLLGWPVAHSHSPALHAAAYAALGLDLAYAAFAVPAPSLAAAVAGARALGFVGLNVTVPHKVAALALAEPDELAARVGATNTLVFRGPDAPPRATNTDVAGFRALLDEHGVDARRGPAIVVGAGGAARAVVVALREAGAREILVATRAGTPLPPGAEVTAAVALADLARLAPAAALLVDCTPRGLAPAPPEGGFPELTALADGAVVVDLVVAASTPIAVAARARGLVAHTGDAMLLHQAAAAIAAFTGLAPPLAPMRAALARSVAAAGAAIVAATPP